MRYAREYVYIYMCVYITIDLSMNCSEYQCVTVCCGMLQCFAVFCSALQCTLKRRRELRQRVAVWCSVLQCVAVSCSVLQCTHDVECR